MNRRYALLAVSTTGALLSLALLIGVVGGAASSAGGEAGALAQDRAGTLLPSEEGPGVSQVEPLSLTEPISIYLPLLENEYVKYPEERAALMALYNSTNGDGWYTNTGWGSDSYHCEWYGVTSCDENEHVTSLYLSGNLLTGTLPAEIGNLRMLTLLGLTGTGIDCGKGGCASHYVISELFPSEFGNLVNLRYLYLGGNQFTALPVEIVNLANLEVLELGGNQIASLPPEIGNLENMQSLWLHGNQLASIPPEIGNLANLYTLSLFVNHLTSLPSEIGNLANLQYLYLDYNQLTTIPVEIGNLVNLQYLVLESNQLASLPPEIGNLANLRGLNLFDNQLTSIPPEIGNLVNLNSLDLRGNHLTGLIPEFLSNLSGLSALYLTENPDLTCWETEEARDWALSLGGYDGPTCFVP